MESNLETDSSFGNEYRIRKPDGSIRYVRALAAPFDTKEGRTADRRGKLGCH